MHGNHCYTKIESHSNGGIHSDTCI
uniref:Uncharacterized protein n=1 Tax=Anguilla anguilla TaxID=7936 RepID=A0A0E9TY60_ANGAN